ncbi:hypothetical protein GCM10010441_48240 [Kitasatospora paracochleata]|uniref:Homing endonuclease LAGLIDADG domain-containing protein n=1 Tax=Kitasatospora paracochleata TaxID=58354 RepID=A0ABT1IRZ0_9ACTN|nr:LAGLIDADG family homing endonuclease [Kitasatospora paracochleata]MCP2307895.1 hypothetical protein [Kitasatospora paracochleata]
MNDFDLARADHAYMFAFLQADGHLSQGTRNRGRISVELSARDAPILEAFQRICPHHSSIRFRTRSTNFASEHSSVIWRVHAREFREQLQALGLPAGRKSRFVAPPAGPFSARDYLRGLIDADGSVGRTGQHLPFVSLTTDSDPLMQFFCHYAECLTGTRRTVNRNARDGIYNILFTREEAVALARELYYPGCLALPRKLAAAATAASWVRPPDMRKAGPRRSWTGEEDRILLGAVDPADAAERLGRSVKSCAIRKWRLVGPRKAHRRFPDTCS